MRIVHISDLHIRHESVNNDKQSALQVGVREVLRRFEVSIEAGGHDELKLELLRARVAMLRPDVIVVTGDLTNFGDRASLEKAGEFLSVLKEDSGAERVLCVPGNHDCLVERAAALQRQRSPLTSSLLWFSRRGVPESQVMQEAAERQFADDTVTPLLLENYLAMCSKHGFGSFDPAQPVQIDAGWGMVSFFPFNSVNGGGLMANKGRIGTRQLAALATLTQGSSWPQHQRSVLIALLHHHPISAPQSRDKDVNRAYDWMDDGPKLLNLINERGFHFVLHGHQHEPFTCAVDYGQESRRQTLIVAAGSASQGGMDNLQNSFNVIDLLHPFQARIRRFDLTVTGFSNRAVAERIYELRSVEQVRFTNTSESITHEDEILQQLVINSFRDYSEAGDAFDYEELTFDVTITEDQLYKGRYRRKGKLVDVVHEDGPIFIITGSPGMDCSQMELRAHDLAAPTGQQVLAVPKVLLNEPTRKLIRVRPRRPLRVGEVFDLCLEFQWQANKDEPNYFDAVSLMGLRRTINKLRYSVSVPWRAAQCKLQVVGNVVEQAEASPLETMSGENCWNYAFDVVNPPPVAYVFQFGPS